jgi:hypothetical protein
MSAGNPGIAESDGGFGRRLESEDLTLFDAVTTQSNDEDRRAWLAVQRSIRRPSGYVYLEIGSHLGGSIQQHLLDPWCRRIVSIDKRPARQPDDRGQPCYYEGNSTARMLENLRRVAPGQVGKVLCFDADAKDLDPQAIPEPPSLCFIDGEHTHRAVLSDFEFCLSVCSPDAAICFHDDWVVRRALSAVIRRLRRRRVRFEARKLRGLTFAIFLGDCPAASDPRVRATSQVGPEWIRDHRRIVWVGRLRRAMRLGWFRERG